MSMVGAFGLDLAGVWFRRPDIDEEWKGVGRAGQRKAEIGSQMKAILVVLTALSVKRELP